MKHSVYLAAQRRVLGREALFLGYHLLHDWEANTVNLMRGAVEVACFADEEGDAAPGNLPMFAAIASSAVGRLRLACRADMNRN